MLSKIQPLEFVASLPDPDSPSASESGRALQIRGVTFMTEQDFGLIQPNNSFPLI